MTDSRAFANLATYNQWMNRKLYNAAAVISDEHLFGHKGAFFGSIFGSIFGTLNHIAVGDILWLKRIGHHHPALLALQALANIPAPTSLDQQLCDSISELTALRATLDEAIVALCQEVSPTQLAEPLAYTSTKGIQGNKPLSDVLLHLFNHQTHHRGQATTLFSQVGVDVGATDLILVIPNVP